MKVVFCLLPLFVACVLTAPTKESAVDAEEALKTLTSLYDIEFETKPEDGTVMGIRIRRNGLTAGAHTGDNVDFTLPEIDIQKINEQTLSINGIRLKRSDLSDLSDVEIEKDIQAEASEGVEDSDRNRRTSGADSLLSFLFSKITSKISSLSGASSGGHGGEPDHSYGPPAPTYDDKSFNLWEFKKQILNTLLQAVKAIKGGVIALGGQIVKAKGQLISTAGKIVATKGDAISGFGRHIASSAFIPAPTAHVAPTAFATASVDHVPDTGYPPSGYPGATYGAPTIPSDYSPSGPTISSGYGVPALGYNKRGASHSQFGAPQELSNGVQAGLLVLKPIQSSPYIKPRGAQDYRDTISAHSEHRPLVDNFQARSYFVRY